MEKVFIAKSFKEAQELGREIAKGLKPSKNGACILALRGDLGGGKTTFVQGMAKELGIKNKILSPTFNIMKRFKVSKGEFSNFYHIDCYRLNNEGLSFLNLEGILENPKNIVVIEWFEKVEGSISNVSMNISFLFVSENERRITIKTK